MHIPVRRPTRPMFSVIGGVAFGALLVGAGPQIPSFLDRPSCAETVVKAVSSDKAVAGTYSCFDDSMQSGLQTSRIVSDSAFATGGGQGGQYDVVQKTYAAGYVYKYI